MAARLAVYYDLDEVEDVYASAGLGYEFEPMEGLTTDISVALGFVGKDAAVGTDGGFQEYRLTLAAVYDVGESVVVAGSVAYTDRLDEDVLPEQDVNVYGGVSLAYEF